MTGCNINLILSVLESVLTIHGLSLRVDLNTYVLSTFKLAGIKQAKMYYNKIMEHKRTQK